jgi:hypothetical protein
MRRDLLIDRSAFEGVASFRSLVPLGLRRPLSLARKQRLEVGKPDIIRPLIGADLDVVAAMVIRAIN